MPANFEIADAYIEALSGNAAEARQRASRALQQSNGKYVQTGAAYVFALAGDTARAQALADEIAKRFPEDTLVQSIHLPAICAQVALGRNDGQKAIELLQRATTYELGRNNIYSVYVRGKAYLLTRQGHEAEAEFQKVIEHRGIVGNDPIGALAHLQLAHAYALQGDTGKAHIAYQDFLALWKDADPDIAILKEAKAEYAKLK